MILELKSPILAVRTLNSLRKLHLPTYVACRFLFSNKVFTEPCNWISEILFWKNTNKDINKFWTHLQYKGHDENNEIVYREFTIPSPFTALAETFVLSYLAELKEFQKSSRVYSYIWPSDTSYPHNFLHYAEGYKKRNYDIELELYKNPNKVAVVTDIEKFYPSISRELVEPKIKSAIENSNAPEEVKQLAQILFEQLWLKSEKGSGVVTGPSLSHVVGDFALKDIDLVLSEKYPNSYFRYVDDMVILVDPNEAQELETYLKTIFQSHSLNINTTKTDHVIGIDWLVHGPHKYRKVSNESFESLLYSLKVYLHLHPNSKERLNSALIESQFRIPINKLFTASGSASFIKPYKKLKMRGWWAAIVATFNTEADLLSKAKAVRKKVLEELNQSLDSLIPTEATKRKWYVQRARYLVNRAIYLMPPSELGFLLAPLSKIPEFSQHVALLNLLVNKEINSLALMPGVALNAGVSLLRNENEEIPVITDYRKNTKALIESAGVIFLNRANPEDAEQLEGFDKSDKDFLAFCSAKKIQARTYDDFSYIDEIQSLSLMKSNEDYKDALDKKFSDEEDYILEALEIGEQYSY